MRLAFDPLNRDAAETCDGTFVFSTNASGTFAKLTTSTRSECGPSPLLAHVLSGRTAPPWLDEGI
jgi:hypothetical protein